MLVLLVLFFASNLYLALCVLAAVLLSAFRPGISPADSTSVADEGTRRAL